MKKIKILILMIVLLVSMFFYINNINNNYVDINDIKSNDVVDDISNANLALMIEDDTGNYVESTSTSWPTGMYFNKNLSGCIDQNGNKIESDMEFSTESRIVTLKTTETIFCYLYFDKKDNIAPEVTVIINNNNTTSPSITITTDEDGTYCVSNESELTNITNCDSDLTGTILITDSITKAMSSGTYYVYIEDAAGNIGKSRKLEINTTSDTPNTSTGGSFGQYLLDNPPAGLVADTRYGNMYRFQGKRSDTVNNYVCYGSNTSCINNINYTYRIIGITTNNLVKVIKNESIGSSVWNSTTSGTPKDNWPESAIYNKIHSSLFLTSSAYFDNDSWRNGIADYSWKYGTIASTHNYNGTQMFVAEDSLTNNVVAKIGLLQLHDGLLAYPGGVPGTSVVGTQSWFSTIDNSNSSTYTMIKKSDTYAYYITTEYYTAGTGSYSGSNALTTSRDINPVFYLSEEVYYISGTGTSTDPFIVSVN